MEKLQAQLEALRALDARIQAVEQALYTWAHTEPACARLDAIPGVGALIATAAVASLGPAKQHDSGRGFAASLGLVPALSGTGEESFELVRELRTHSATFIKASARTSVRTSRPDIRQQPILKLQHLHHSLAKREVAT